uniref:DUF5666 domain-containing protein n=1 Tax=uncultured bacterium BLR9 TaxID=506525 RepID=C0INA4_9BACT|nr:hypothetical protein AKSOIL_0145 [uncultured bacterium BLR9]
MKSLFLAVAAAGCLLAGTASAHHSLSGYNRQTSETMQGTVKSFGWSNPHVQLVVVVQAADGAMQQWNFEAGSTGRLANAGFNRHMVAPGDKISVTYNPKRDGSHGGFLVSVISASGRKYDTQRTRGPTRGGAEEG